MAKVEKKAGREIGKSGLKSVFSKKAPPPWLSRANVLNTSVAGRRKKIFSPSQVNAVLPGFCEDGQEKNN